jgi:hypothetical protein
MRANRTELGQAIARHLSTFPVSFLGKPEKEIRAQGAEMKAEQTPPRLDAKGAPIKTRESSAEYSKLSEEYPKAGALNSAGGSPEALKLSGELNEYNQVADEADMKIFNKVRTLMAKPNVVVPARAKAIYDQVNAKRAAYRKTHPMVSQYMTWYGSIMEKEGKAEGPEIPQPVTSVARFLEERGKPARSGDPVRVESKATPAVKSLADRVSAEVSALPPGSKLTIATARKLTPEGQAYLIWKDHNPGRSAEVFAQERLAKAA